MPRAYQNEAIKKVIEEWDSGTVATLLEMAVGLGKTVVFSWVARIRPGRCLFLAHRTELIKQARDKLIDINPDDVVEIDQGECRASARMDNGIGGRLVVASKDTLCREKRLLRFSPDAFDTLVIDEAHRAVRKNKTYWAIIERFAAPPIGKGTAKLLFVTATVRRADEEALGGIVQSVAYRRTIMEGIDDGYLVPIRTQQLVIDSIDVDMRGVKMTRNDLGELDISPGDLARMAKSEKYILQLAQPLFEIANKDPQKPKSAVVFMPSVWAAQKVSDVLNSRFRAGCADCVSGNMTGDRAKILRNFNRGKTQFLINCDVLTEGWDCDRVDIVVPRLTASTGKLTQMVGRGTRPLDGCVDIWQTPELRRAAIASSPKTHLLVLDPCGVTDNVKLVSTADIFSGNYTPAEIMLAKANAKTSGRPINEELKRAKEQKRIEAEEKLKNVKVMVNYHLNATDLFTHFGLKPITKWCPPQFAGKMATPGQTRLIESRGVKMAENITFYEAKKLIEGIVQRESTMSASESQKKTLVRYGINPNVTYREASKIIQEVAKAGWKRPEGMPQYKPENQS
jgi:superfamily II DNA or RNA helicase